MSNGKKEKIIFIKSNKTPIELAAYIDEINMRERKYKDIKNLFYLNINQIKYLTDKVNKIDFKNMKTFVSKEIKDEINNFFKTPKEKYNYPMTSSMLYGWEKPINIKVFKKSYCKNSNTITKFADDYYNLTRKNPFTSVNIFSNNTLKEN